MRAPSRRRATAAACTCVIWWWRAAAIVSARAARRSSRGSARTGAHRRRCRRARRRRRGPRAAEGVAAANGAVLDASSSRRCRSRGPGAGRRRRTRSARAASGANGCRAVAPSPTTVHFAACQPTSRGVTASELVPRRHRGRRPAMRAATRTATARLACRARHGSRPATPIRRRRALPRRRRRAASATRRRQLTRRERKQLGRLRARKVKRVVRHIDPWSVLKVSLLFYFCLFIVLDGGRRRAVEPRRGRGHHQRHRELLQGRRRVPDLHASTASRSSERRFLIGLILVIAGTGLNVLLAVLFNLISDLVGGIRITVIEEEIGAADAASTETQRRRQPNQIRLGIAGC